MVLIPTLLLTIFEARREKERLEVGIMADLQSLSCNVQFSLRSWYHINLKPVQELAALAGESSMTPSAQSQHETEILTRVFPDFASMHVTDAEGRTVAFEPRVNGRKSRPLAWISLAGPGFRRSKPNNNRWCWSLYGTSGCSLPLIIVSLVSSFIRENHWFGLRHRSSESHERARDNLRPYLSDKMAGLTFTDSQSRVIASTRSERSPCNRGISNNLGVPEVLDNMMFLLRPMIRVCLQ